MENLNCDECRKFDPKYVCVPSKRLINKNFKAIGVSNDVL